MRKIILAALAATVALPGVAAPAMAQSARELRRDRQDIREERREYRQALRHGDRRDIRDERRDLNRARREYREDLRDRAWGRNDWRAYRQGHRNLYARGGWNAPFRYQSFRPGIAIGRPYYAQRYWIADPGRYRLPPARGNQRWVRHYNDVLLIDQRRGRVIDVIRNFFW
ncbi:RcnB family protein [Sphingomonas sp. 2R-10]|uniref:RcnB family protein n=1 Tax=Sphingomonas sp. 2R-10 TaxID=3045148 RepID=UPI000F793B3B|nr:RcnB family protein [Sphingomonas sp. 2R-10]MDJ0275302.1 RcnB family protein [Sphingomonas sp. 2R-10]